MSATDQVAGRGVGRVILSVLVRGVLPIVVVAGGVLGAIRLIQTAPEASQTPPRQSATLVETRLVTPCAERATVQALGTVIAAQEISLQPQVSGVIQAIHPALVAGGRIGAGEMVVTIDPADYEVAVRKAEAALARAEAQLESAELELERVRGLVERHATNQKELDDARTAQEAVAADVAAAQASLEKAKLDLSRTVVTAPFACLVIDEGVDVGSLVTSQTKLATLVGTDEYWVRTSVPVEQLRWIRIPGRGEEAGSAVRIAQRLGPGDTAEWQGQVVRLLGDLEPQGRMAQVLVTVPDPLGEAGEGRVPLLLGSYVDVVIAGRELASVMRLGRDELHDGDVVWIMNAQGQLVLRDVVVAFRGRDHVLVRDGLGVGERLVASDLPSPVAGMALREAEVGAGEAEAALTPGAGSAAGVTP